MAKKSEKANPKRTTSTNYARFYVGPENDKGELQGNGKFKKFKDAQAKAEQVAKKEGNSWVVSPRGVALWTHDGDGLFQVGHITAEQKKFYSAESYLDAEDAHFSRWEAPENPLEVFYASRGKDDEYVIVERGNYVARVHKDNKDKCDKKTLNKIHRQKNTEGLMYDEESQDWIPLSDEFNAPTDEWQLSMKRNNPLSRHYIPPGHPLTPARPSDPLPSRRRRPKRPWKAEGNGDSMMSMGINVALFSLAAYVGYQFYENTTKE